MAKAKAEYRLYVNPDSYIKILRKKPGLKYITHLLHLHHWLQQSLVHLLP